MSLVLTTDQKYQALLEALREMGSAVIAFSGGLDSTLLLHAARQALADKVLAVTVVAAYTPEHEREEAKTTAQTMQARHLLLNVPFPEAIRNNPPERCYLCKLSLFTRLTAVARAEGIPYVLDGTNLDDLDDYRPGRKALGELGILSPLLAAGLTKQDIRDLSRVQGLAWDKPAGACLLSRLPHGTRIEEAELRRIDQAEGFLRELGFTAVRLRSHGDLARIEVPRDQVAVVIEADRQHGIQARLTALGYRYVAVDLAGYRMGSLNEPAS
ncbi:ATP-dependent sacrificial sulfur transferase LarE [Desulfovibrio sp. TomC]|uniref:ATP-dependent sacrificial sulfur transferase LarE n=1 Tax=Desulfovibrio sp. TomC TaxID=1562888 RepID=UPI000573DFDE|nr:ATP-dependent sacrificial sulfur transferase LarE [Desulfovibrio sp. TomC]KHK00747.1 ATP-utilizing enzyme of the PP-loop superfamily [Desulfovibrio sp. TomC]